ncbi:MAG: helix-turn-helix transcriptional regulator [Ruminococcaceae bacterium]|nr:helix-turn-helix transcriptional regulator [Oscillospiraceae bacterium]
MKFFDSSFSRLDLHNVLYVPKSADQIHQNYGGRRRYFEIFYKYPGHNVIHFDRDVSTLSQATVGFYPIHNQNNLYAIDVHKASDSINIFFECDSALPDQPQYIDCSRTPEIHKLFLKINSIWSHRDKSAYVESMSYFYKIIATLSKANSQCYLPENKYRLISDSITYLQEHYLDPDFDCGILAEMSGISFSYYKKLFQQRFSTTPKQYLIAHRLQYARSLLMNSSFTVTEIADICGYSNIYYFSQAFKNEFGLSPTAYMEQNRFN